MNVNEIRQQAVTNFMRLCDVQVRDLETWLDKANTVNLEGHDPQIMREELKLWKKAQAVGLRAAQQGGDDVAS